MDFYQKVKRDLQSGLKEGIAVVKEGASVVKEKVQELTEEGKRQYTIFLLKTKVQKEIAELGGRVYDLSVKLRNPMLDKKVKALIARIKKFETQVTRLEGKGNVKSLKTSTKHTAKRKGK
jgi:ABC-type dipeptide/oligopeptide/nickel transport system ATPase component